SADSLFEAITTGYECPSGMTGRIMARLDSTGNKATHPPSRRTPVPRSYHLVPFAAGLAIFAVAAGVIGWTVHGKPALPKASLLAPAAASFPRTWNFNTPEQANDFKVTFGSWHYVSDGGVAGSGCMETDSEDFNAEWNDSPRDPKRPLLISS